MKCLTTSEARAVRAIAETFYPRGAGISGLDAGVVDYVDGYLAKLAFWERAKVRVLFSAIEYLPAAAAFDRSRKFSSLSHDERAEILGAWEFSTVHLRRMAFKALRYLMGLAYVSSGAVAEELGIVESELGDPLEHLQTLANASDRGAAE